MIALTLKEITFILKQHSVRNHNTLHVLPVQKSTPPHFFCYEHLILLTIDKKNFFSDVENTDQHAHHYTVQQTDDALRSSYTGKEIIA